MVCRSLWFVDDVASFRCVNLMPPGASLAAAAAAAVTENALRDESTVPKTDKKVNNVQDAQKRRLTAARRLFLLRRIFDLFAKQKSYSVLPGFSKERQSEGMEKSASAVKGRRKKKEEKKREQSK